MYEKVSALEKEVKAKMDEAYKVRDRAKRKLLFGRFYRFLDQTNRIIGVLRENIVNK